MRYVTVRLCVLARGVSVRVCTRMTLCARSVMCVCARVCVSVMVATSVRAVRIAYVRV